MLTARAGSKLLSSFDGFKVLWITSRLWQFFGTIGQMAAFYVAYVPGKAQYCVPILKNGFFRHAQARLYLFAFAALAPSAVTKADIGNFMLGFACFAQILTQLCTAYMGTIG